MCTTCVELYVMKIAQIFKKARASCRCAVFSRRSLRVHARRRNEFCTAKKSHADVFSDAFFVAQKIRANPEILA